MSSVDGPSTDARAVRVSAPFDSTAADRVARAARETAADTPVVRTGPSGAGVLLLATADGETVVHRHPEAATVREVVRAVEAGNPLPGETITHDPDTTTLPVPSEGPLAVGTRRLLAPCGWRDPLDPTAWTFVSTTENAEPVAGTSLRGRGRGDAARDDLVSEAWTTVREQDGEPVVVCNANEASRLPQGDRTLLAGAPLAVLDGIAAVADFVGAADAVLLVNETETALQRHLRDATDAVADRLPVVPQLVAGPDVYRAGEPTAALEGLEGADRIEPRLQPPTPAEYGLYGRPTVIHTPRTFAHVRQAIATPGAYTGRDPGTRLVTVAGEVADPVTVELAPDDSLAGVRGAVDLDEGFEFAVVGGELGGQTRDLDIAPTARALTAAGLGTDGVVELFSDRCPVAVAGERARFASEENSGRCVPGREGTKQLTELLRDVYSGAFDPEKIRELARVMRRSSNCLVGAQAPRPVTTAIEAFEPEFRAHTDGRCSSDRCFQ
ncbi:NADH-ubiquinone oxidoreductase-F iron-sulfur binding region domain-containing protein [Natronomonas sp. EA1]|uniref:NADH-ubiquinone oxidoreductase-F iron-sulfur binding region domain-containing protein n=1 Tax=Natronomonas sp. EA1 TaxID=3421655 RepID=UPI003EBBF3D6